MRVVGASLCSAPTSHLTTSNKVALAGTLPVRAGLPVAGLEVVVDVGGVQRTLTLDAKGKSTPKGTDTFALAVKLADGAVVANPTAKFTLKIGKATLAGLLCDEGVAAAVTGKKQPRSITATVLFDGRHFTAEVPVTYDNGSGKSAKLKR